MDLDWNVQAKRQAIGEVSICLHGLKLYASRILRRDGVGVTVFVFEL